MFRKILTGGLILAVGLTLLANSPSLLDDDYLRWEERKAITIAVSKHDKGRVGRLWKRAGDIFYDLRATWFTPEVIRATARYLQIQHSLSDEETRALVEEAESINGTVVLVDLMAGSVPRSRGSRSSGGGRRNFSGAIERKEPAPATWTAYLHAKGVKPGSALSVTGVKTPELENIKVFSWIENVRPGYRRYWVVFPLHSVDCQVLFPDSASKAAMLVKIGDIQGKARWTIPKTFRKYLNALPCTRE